MSGQLYGRGIIGLLAAAPIALATMASEPPPKPPTTPDPGA